MTCIYFVENEETMKNKLFAISAFAAMTITCACGDDNTEETLSEKCHHGNDAACLIGLWELQAIQDAAHGYNVAVDFSTGPGKLEIYENGDFKYTYATAVTSLMYLDCGNLFDTGKWTYNDENKTISIKFTVGEQCNSDPTSAVVKVNAYEMTFDKQVFQTSEDISSGTQPVEYFKRIGTL